jgi:hypothetical protein
MVPTLGRCHNFATIGHQAQILVVTVASHGNSCLSTWDILIAGVDAV